MSKLIYITESQLQEIVGNGSYLNNDNTNAYRFGGAEITTGGTTGNYTDGDIEPADPVTTDGIANQLTNKHKVRGMGGEPGNYLRRNIIPESNKDLTGKQNTFRIPKKNLDDLKDRLNNYNGPKNIPGVKRGKYLINNDGHISYDNAYRVLDDMNNGSEGNILDPDGDLRRALKQKIEFAKNISKGNRNAKMERGENVIKSAPKTGKGGAHTPKGKNVIGVEYQ